MENFADILESDVPVSLMMPAEGSDTGTPIEPFMRRGHAELWITVRDGRRLLLKGLPAEIRNHPEEVARLRKEYTIGLRIDHPGIARVLWFEAFPETGPVIVMEYVDGVSLLEFLKGKKREERHSSAYPELKVRRKIAFEIAETLEYIHSSGFSHRDLKPDNILITARGNRPKIIDFGLGDGEDYLLYKKSLATREFGAPEQQEASVGDSRADVYSFGRILEMLLPERKFSKLRQGCMHENPDKRISMEEAVRILDPARNTGSTGKIVAVAVSLMALCALIVFLLLTLSPVATTDKAGNDNMADTTEIGTPSAEPEGEPAEKESKVKAEKESPSVAIESPAGEAIPKPEVTPAPSRKESEPGVTQHDAKEAEGSGGHALKKWIEKYNKETDEVFRKYGPPTIGMLSDPSKDFRLNRMKECKDIAKRAEQEMLAAGLSQGEIDMVLQTYWYHYTLTMNRIDSEMF